MLRGPATTLPRPNITSVLKAKEIRIGTETKRGYERAFFLDAWHRYLPPPNTGSDETSETTKLAPDYDEEETIATIPLDVSTDPQARSMTDVSGVSIDGVNRWRI